MKLTKVGLIVMAFNSELEVLCIQVFTTQMFNIREETWHGISDLLSITFYLMGKRNMTAMLKSVIL